jgi:hypothetical protein
MPTSKEKKLWIVMMMNEKCKMKNFREDDYMGF